MLRLLELAMTPPSDGTGDKMSKVIFVYGTLKQGFPNHGHISSQRYLGVAKTKPKYAMYRYGSYPGLVEAELAASGGFEPPHDVLIHGELYEVNDQALVHLDRLEGVGSGLFERKPLEIQESQLVRLPVLQGCFDAISHGVVEAYFFRKNLSGAANCGPFWGAR